MRQRRPATANELLKEQRPLSADEQQRILEDFIRTTNRTNFAFLFITALLIGLVGVLFGIFALGKRRQLVSADHEEDFLQRLVDLSTSATWIVCSILLIQYARHNSVRLLPLSDDDSEMKALIKRESSTVISRCRAQTRRHTVLGFVWATVAAVQLFYELLNAAIPLGAADLLLFVWQPLLHFVVVLILSWMRSSSLAVLALHASRYTLEGA